MNGAHDLGGMHGFGPINPEPEAEEPTFHADWERRVFGLTLAVGALGKWNIDMSRHARERQHPVDYLQHSYYENWLAGLEKLLIETGLVTESELKTGKADMPGDESVTKKVLRKRDVAELLARGTPSTVVVDIPPKFQPGDKVRAINRHPNGHTREPGYVRGRLGVVYAYEGVHIYPDRNADGSKEGQHLYRVRFEAAELWGEQPNNRGAVYVDLWEDYLQSAGKGE